MCVREGENECRAQPVRGDAERRVRYRTMCMYVADKMRCAIAYARSSRCSRAVFISIYYIQYIIYVHTLRGQEVHTEVMSRVRVRVRSGFPDPHE